MIRVLALRQVVVGAVAGSADISPPMLTVNAKFIFLKFQLILKVLNGPISKVRTHTKRGLLLRS